MYDPPNSEYETSWLGRLSCVSRAGAPERTFDSGQIAPQAGGEILLSRFEAFFQSASISATPPFQLQPTVSSIAE